MRNPMKRMSFRRVADLTADEIDDMQGDKTATEVQFAMHDTLNKMGLDVWPELRLPSPVHKSGYFLADLAILGKVSRKPLALIECKPDDTEALYGDQLAAYCATGLPWHLCTTQNHQAVIAWSRQFREQVAE